MTDADIDAACALYYYDDTEKGLFKKARGTYAKVTTVEDILSTAYDLNDFMFIKGEGKKATVASNALNIGGSDTVGITNPLTKEGNDYSYTSPLSPNPKFLFKMTNGKLSSIVVTNSATADTNGTYVPFEYQAPKINFPIGYNGTISFRLNAPFADSSGIKVKVDNGPDLTEGSDFTLSSGSIIITLSSDIVQSLTGPNHTFSAKLSGYPERTISFTFSNTPSPGGGGSGGGSSGHVVLNTGVSNNTFK